MKQAIHAAWIVPGPRKGTEYAIDVAFIGGKYPMVLFADVCLMRTKPAKRKRASK